jgi:hypothetical protein
MARSQLVQFLLDHGVKAYQRGGMIYAYDMYSDAAGYVHERIVALKPSLRTVKVFLGY